jgi:cold shock CspA family protein
MSDVKTGRVQGFDCHRGWGYVVPDDGGKVLRYYVDQADGEPPSNGDLVEYIAGRSLKGSRRAENVRTILR